MTPKKLVLTTRRPRARLIVIVVAAAAVVLGACGSANTAAPATALRTVSTTVGTADAVGNAAELCIHIRDAKTYDEAIVLVGQADDYDSLMAACGDTIRARVSEHIASRDQWEVECPGSSSVQVVYDGTATANYGDMTAAFPTGTRQSSPDLPIQLKGDATPMGFHFCSDAGEFLYISLQNKIDTGSIACTITVDGVLISSNRSSGAYVIASCDGET